MIVAALGYLGATLLALCSVPLLVKTIRDGHADGVSLPFLLMWGAGGLAMLAHVALLGMGWALLANYTANELIVFVVLFYRLFRRAKG